MAANPFDELAPGRMSGDERRTRLLDAARGEFAKSGYRGASIAKIAHSAQCSVPLLYKHFRNKEEIFAAALTDVMERIERGFDEWIDAEPNMPTAQRWREVVPGMLTSPAYIEMLQLRMLAAMVERPSIREALRAHHHRHEERVGRLIQRGINDGTIRSDIDPAYVAWMWTGLTMAICYRHAIDDDGKEAMIPLATTFLNSLQP